MIFDFYFINYFALEYCAYSRVFRSFAAFVVKPFYTKVFPYFDPLVLVFTKRLQILDDCCKIVENIERMNHISTKWVIKCKSQTQS